MASASHCRGNVEPLNRVDIVVDPHGDQADGLGCESLLGCNMLRIPVEQLSELLQVALRQVGNRIARHLRCSRKGEELSPLGSGQRGAEGVEFGVGGEVGLCGEMASGEIESAIGGGFAGETGDVFVVAVADFEAEIVADDAASEMAVGVGNDENFHRLCPGEASASAGAGSCLWVCLLRGNRRYRQTQAGIENIERAPVMPNYGHGSRKIYPFKRELVIVLS